MIRAHNDKDKVIVLQTSQNTLTWKQWAFSYNTNFAYLSI